MRTTALAPLKVILVMLLVLLPACNAPAGPAAEPPATAADTALPTEPVATVTESGERVKLDPCSLLSADEVSPILGGPVQVQPAGGTGGCAYSLSSGDAAGMVQIVLSAAQGEEAKALTILGIGFLAGFSGDPSISAEFEALNNDLPGLSLLELVTRLGDIFQGTGVNAIPVEQPDGGGLWLLYQTDAYSQGTLLLVRGDEYVSLTQIGGDMSAEPEGLAALGEVVFERLPANFYLLDEDGDGSFSIGLSDDNDGQANDKTGEVQEPPEVVNGLVWVSAPNAGQVYAIDPMADELIATIDVGRFPSDIAVAGGKVWVVSETEGTVWRIDPTSYEVVQTLTLNGNTLHIDASQDALWVVGGLGVRILDLNTGTRYDVVYNPCYDVTIGENSVWVSQTQDQQLLQIDPVSHKVVATVKLEGQPTGILYAHGYVWTVLLDKKELIAIDPSAGQVAHSEPFRYVVHGMAAGPERLWYTHPTALYNIEAGTWSTDALLPANIPSGITFYAGSLWATSSEDGVVTRYHPQSGEVLAVIDVGSDVVGIAAGE